MNFVSTGRMETDRSKNITIHEKPNKTNDCDNNENLINKKRSKWDSKI